MMKTIGLAAAVLAWLALLNEGFQPKVARYYPPAPQDGYPLIQQKKDPTYSVGWACGPFPEGHHAGL